MLTSQKPFIISFTLQMVSANLALLLMFNERVSGHLQTVPNTPSEVGLSATRTPP